MEPIEGLPMGTPWTHHSRLGTYRCVQDPPGIVTLTPQFEGGEAKTVASMAELRQVDVDAG